MNHILFLSFLLCLFGLVNSETRDCYSDCTDDTDSYDECWDYGYSSCYQCNYDSYLCIADCGWFYVTDCDSCDCSGVSTAGVCVIIFSIVFCLICCAAVGRNRRRRRYARNGMVTPLKSSQPVAAVITVSQPGIFILIFLCICTVSWYM